MSERIATLEARTRGADSLDGAAHYNLAIGYIGNHQRDKADSALARSLELEPQFAPAWLARSIVFAGDENHWRRIRRRGDSAVANEGRLRTSFARHAYMIDPFVDLRILGGFMQFEDFGDALQYYFGADFRRFDDAYRGGEQSLVEGDYAKAYDNFLQASGMWTRIAGLRRTDTLPEWLLFDRALAAAHSNHLAEAAMDFATLVEKNVKEEGKDSTQFVPLRTNEYRYMLAAVQQRTGNRIEATRGYQDVIANDLGNYMAHVQLARIYEADHDWAQSITERTRATEVNPEDHTLVFDLGAAEARAGHWAEAEAALLRARAMQPRYARTYHALGFVQMQLAKNDEAKASLTHFLAIAPSRFSTQINDARTRLAQLP